MKLLHLADLHIGKMLYGYSLIDDQRYLFESIYETIQQEGIDVVILAGDIYDRALPSVEAVNLLDEFLEHLINECQVKVLLISGNHDSASRLNFGSRILEKRGLYIVSQVKEELSKITFEDDYGKVNFYLLPYCTRQGLKEVLGIDERKISLDELLKIYFKQQDFNFQERNVMVAHLTCIGRMTEEVGGLEWVSPECFEGFDYVALGHLHACHRVNQKDIYYAGSPLRFSVDEAYQKKGIMMVELADKGMVRVETIPLVPRRDLVVKEGYLQDLLQDKEDEHYVFLNLLDETLQVNAADRAREVYPYLLGLSYQKLNAMPHSHLQHELHELSTKSPLALFTSFYEAMTEKEISQEVVDIFNRYYQKEGEHEN